jgi:hypothetical protein
MGGLGIVSDLGFYGSQPSRTFSEKRPYLFVTFAFFAVGIRFILQAGTMKPRRGRQADPAAKRCRATRSPERGASDLRPYLFVSFVVETFHHAGPFEAFAFFAVESTAREEIRSIGEICAKSSFHQPSFIVPALKTAN